MAKYLLIQHYEDGAGCAVPMGRWDPADIRAHIDFQVALNADLIAAGELVDAQAAAQEAKRVVSDGVTSSVRPATGDRPALAAYRVVDVESEERAVQIAVRMSAAPGPGGVPIQQPVEVRPVMRVMTPP
jgi:hypothetical protein